MTYKPTTATIRAEYAGRVEAWEMTYAEQEAARAEEVVEFDRWLKAHDAQVAAQAWDEGRRASEREYECMFSGHPGTEEGEMCDECMGWTNPYHADRTERGE